MYTTMLRMLYYSSVLHASLQQASLTKKYHFIKIIVLHNSILNKIFSTSCLNILCGIWHVGLIIWTLTIKPWLEFVYKYLEYFSSNIWIIFVCWHKITDILNYLDYIISTSFICTIPLQQSLIAYQKRKQNRSIFLHEILRFC